MLHAGWRGLHDGIIEHGAELLNDLAGAAVEALVGPCVHPEAYEFGPEELDMVADRYGDDVRSTTKDGRAALDMPTAVTKACERAGWNVSEVGPCTSGESYFSHRTRTETGRLTTVAWIEVP